MELELNSPVGLIFLKCIHTHTHTCIMLINVRLPVIKKWHHTWNTYGVSKEDMFCSDDTASQDSSNSSSEDEVVQRSYLGLY